MNTDEASANSDYVEIAIIIRDMVTTITSIVMDGNPIPEINNTPVFSFTNGYDNIPIKVSIVYNLFFIKDGLSYNKNHVEVILFEMKEWLDRKGLKLLHDGEHRLITFIIKEPLNKKIYNKINFNETLEHIEKTVQGIGDRDAPVYRDAIVKTLEPYTVVAKKWWDQFEYKTFRHSGLEKIEGAPSGMYAKCSRSPFHSCIYGIQAFPFVDVSAVRFPKLIGGTYRHIEQICKNGLEIDDFTLITRKGLKTTLNGGLFICYIPTYKYNQSFIARWIYMRPDEILSLIKGFIPETLLIRLIPMTKKFKSGEN